MKTEIELIYDSEIKKRAESADWCAGIASSVFKKVRAERRKKMFTAAATALPAAAAVVLGLAILFSLRSSYIDGTQSISPVAKMIYTDDLSGFMSNEVDQILGYGY